MKNILVYIISFLVLTSYSAPVSFLTEPEDLSQLPKIRSTDVLIPNEKIAIEMAMVVLKPIYKEKIDEQTPFYARLVNDTLWNVYGIHKQLQHKDGIIIKTGGEIQIYLHKYNCRVISIFQSR